MVLIYIKLGTATEFTEPRLGVMLSDPGVTATALDYNNITPKINSGLSAGDIVQITEREYNEIINTLLDPITVNSGYLLTLNQFMNPCPNPGFVMFGLYQGQWYKILWSTLISCLGSSSTKFSLFRRVPPVGDLEGDVPQIGSNTFTNAGLIGKNDHKKLIVTLNGAFLYHVSLYTPAGDELDYEYYYIDPLTGQFIKTSAFADKDVFSIQEI